jgi:hypothetical protein
MRPGHETFANGDIIPGTGWFIPSPTECSHCNKPHMSHRTVTDGSFTVIFACQHTDDPDALSTLRPNKTVAKLFPENHSIPWDEDMRTCLGHVLVVKHAHLEGVTNHDLPIVNLPESDFAAVDDMVRV